MAHLMTKLTVPLLCTAGLLGGCSDSDNASTVPTPTPTPVMWHYQVSITNLTYGQPFSPPAFILQGDMPMWEIGQPASEGLERLAEGGDSDMLRMGTGVLAAKAADGPVAPGMTAMLALDVEQHSDLHGSVLTMLVNTNDGFTGLNNIALANMAVGESQSWDVNAYDAGTEANTEAMGTMPGPADGGVGFDATRDDVNFVAMHPGVVSKDDGLDSSVLTQAQRFDNPVARITVTRTE